MQETRNHFNVGTFVVGIFFIFTAIIAFQDIESSLLSAVLCYAIFAIVKGVYELLIHRKFKELIETENYFPVIAGVIDIIVGIFLLFNLDIGMTTLPFIFALWFTADSICGLLVLDIAKTVSRSYFWFSFIINALGVFIGLILFLNPILSALTLNYLIGLYLMLFGIEKITYSFV